MLGEREVGGAVMPPFFDAKAIPSVEVGAGGRAPLLLALATLACPNGRGEGVHGRAGGCKGKAIRIAFGERKGIRIALDARKVGPGSSW